MQIQHEGSTQLLFLCGKVSYGPVAIVRAARWEEGWSVHVLWAVGAEYYDRVRRRHYAHVFLFQPEESLPFGSYTA